MRDGDEPDQCACWRRHSKRLKRQQEVCTIPPLAHRHARFLERRCCSRALLFWSIWCNRSPRHQASSIFNIIACVWKCRVLYVWRGTFEDSSRRCQWMDHWTVRLGGWLSVFRFLLRLPTVLQEMSSPTANTWKRTLRFLRPPISRSLLAAGSDFKNLCKFFQTQNYNITTSIFISAFKILWMSLSRPVRPGQNFLGESKSLGSTVNPHDGFPFQKVFFFFYCRESLLFSCSFSNTINSIKTQSFRMWSRQVWESASVCKLLDHADEYEVRKLNLVYVLKPFNAWKICGNLYQCAVLGKIVTIATSKKSWSSSHLLAFSAFLRRRCF